MKKKIEVPIGMALVELAERAAEHGDERATLLVGNIAHELLTTDLIDVADNADFLTIVEYSGMLAEAVRTGQSIESIKSSEFRTSLDD